MDIVIIILIALGIFSYLYYGIRKTVSELKNGECGACDCSTGSCGVKEED